jgi:hypothetical protein
MKYFSPKSTAGGDQSVEGQQVHNLPLITCPYCNNHRGMTNINYPWVDINRIFDSPIEKRLRWGRARIRGTDSREFTWQEFEELKIIIRKVLDPVYPLPPATLLGIFQGKVFAKPPASDFVMPDFLTLLARRKVVQRLSELGNKLRYFEVKLKQQKDQNEDYVQLWDPPLGISGPSSRNKYCEHCGRGSGRVLFIIKQPKVELDSHIFVLKDALSPIIFTEKLVKDINCVGFSGLHFEEIPSE